MRNPSNCDNLNSLCLCQQSFKLKCNEYNDSLKEIHETVPKPTHNEPEVKEVYVGLLDDLNARYDQLMSLLQQLLDNSKESEAVKEVSHSNMPFARFTHDNSCGHGREKN